MLIKYRYYLLNYIQFKRCLDFQKLIIINMVEIIGLTVFPRIFSINATALDTVQTVKVFFSGVGGWNWATRGLSATTTSWIYKPGASVICNDLGELRKLSGSFGALRTLQDLVWANDADATLFCLLLQVNSSLAEILKLKIKINSHVELVY